MKHVEGQKNRNSVDFFRISFGGSDAEVVEREKWDSAGTHLSLKRCTFCGESVRRAMSPAKCHLDAAPKI